MTTHRWIPTLALAVLFAGGGALLAANVGRGAVRTPRAPKAPTIAKPWSQLELTDDQKTKYVELEKTKQEAVKAANKAFEDGMMALLTDAQKTKLQELKSTPASRPVKSNTGTGVRGSGETVVPR